MHARAWIRVTTVAAFTIAAVCCSVGEARAGVPCGAPRPPGDPLLIEHPKKTKQVSFNLVQAYENCFVPDTTTEGGLGACTPETRNEAAGDPMSGWRWGTSGGRGAIRLTPACKGAADVGVTLDLAGVVDGSGTPVTGTGTLQLGVKLSMDDPTGGSMTTVQMPIAIPFGLIDGRVKFRTTATAMLATDSLPPLPNVTSLEIASADMFDQEAGLLEVRDGNGTVFLRPGLETFPKNLPCSVPHGGKSKPVALDLVQSFASCDPMFANATTEGGLDACAPATTFNEQGGSPADGWVWSPSAGGGALRLFPRLGPGCAAKGTSVPGACFGPLSPLDDTSDVVITLKLKGVMDQLGPASGDGSLGIVVRTTMDDRMNGPVTFEGILAVPFTLNNGKTIVKTSYDAVLNQLPHPSLPTCASTEILAAAVYDENNIQFATAGLWLP
jgi:hypothetical protein